MPCRIHANEAGTQLGLNGSISGRSDRSDKLKCSKQILMRGIAFVLWSPTEMKNVACADLKFRQRFLQECQEHGYIHSHEEDNKNVHYHDCDCMQL